METFSKWWNGNELQDSIDNRIDPVLLGAFAHKTDDMQLSNLLPPGTTEFIVRINDQLIFVAEPVGIQYYKVVMRVFRHGIELKSKCIFDGKAPNYFNYEMPLDFFNFQSDKKREPFDLQFDIVADNVQRRISLVVTCAHPK